MFVVFTFVAIISEYISKDIAFLTEKIQHLGFSELFEEKNYVMSCMQIALISID